MLKNILKISLLGIFLISCSESDEQIEDLVSVETPIVNNPDLESIGLKIFVDKQEGNILESFIFKLEQKNKSTYFGDLAQHLDSLVFKISDYNGTKKIFEKLENGNTGTIQFNHNFYFPGNYNASILGYKSGKITYKDDIDLKISNQKDFLVTNWNNFSENTPIGYFNALSKNSLVFHNRFENSNPYISVTNSWDNINDYTTDQIKQMDRDFLYNYFVKFYSIPQYTEANTSNLKDIYTQNFKKSIKNDIPVSIWITAKNKIALMKEYSTTNSSQFYGYRIIAEPNN
ncbi:hypothetical protein OF897_12945 [Chryseobacterium formosus]|uniref:Uncharacterized protein n=1 Tax=Chryseobacterium formosus TaxID=1537363 RepID=A0ABT3XT08_9FLAO|nr:hypothetical protein [Chryseobacterium formosus]MCX8524821.1 hypothetical protein [Chryseobacterium formosus]